MSAHRPHPLSGEWMNDTYDDPADAVLYDLCDRCAEHAARPWQLDPETLGCLWRLMVAVEYDPSGRGRYRTEAEADACRALFGIAVMIRRTHPTLNVLTWPWTGQTE